MAFRIPNQNKQFTVDNESMTRGNIYSTFNISFDKEKGRIKLNNPIVLWKSTADSADFVSPTAMFASTIGGAGGANEIYILTTKTADFGGVWSTFSFGKLTGADSPALARDASSDMCMAWNLLHVTTTAGLHYANQPTSTTAWTLNVDAIFKDSRFIILHFLDTNRLYLFNTTNVASVDSTYTPIANSGAYSQTNLLNITCARASSKRIWYATQETGGRGNSKIYEWDGVSPNPLNIYTINTAKIQAITILNDLPVAIDNMGRLWFYDGYTFELKDGACIPRFGGESLPVVNIHRNGMITDKNKIYVLVASYASWNATERSLAGIWCYDPSIGFYHFASPDNTSQITTAYALTKGIEDFVFVAGYSAGITNITAVDKISKTDSQMIGESGILQRGFITTQFMESKNLTDMLVAIGLKYRKMIYSAAQIEVKYRTWKNIQCNGTITWTSATTFTIATTTLDGTGSYYCTPVVVGDEVMVQNGANTGLIAHITIISIDGATATVTIDRNATLTSGTAYAMFCNYTLLKTITNDGATFKNIRLGIPTTMIQVKLVMQWKGYYDEISEIMIPEKANEIPS